MDEQQKPPEEQEASAHIPSSKWPWIVAGLVAMLLTLWNKISDKDAEIQRLNTQVTNVSLQTNELATQNANNALEVARLTRQLMEATNNHDTPKDSTDSSRSRRSGGAEQPAR